MPDLVLPRCDVPGLPAVATGAQWRQQHPTWLLSALRSGTAVDHGGIEPGRAYRLEVHPLGDLPLPDGRLIAAHEEQDATTASAAATPAAAPPPPAPADTLRPTLRERWRRLLG